MWAIVYQGKNNGIPRVMSTHRSEERAQEVAAWIAYAGTAPWTVYKELKYDLPTEMIWDRKNEMYQIGRSPYIERLWVVEIEKRRS